MIIEFDTFSHPAFSIIYYVVYLFFIIAYKENLFNDVRDSGIIERFFAYSFVFIFYIERMGFAHKYILALYTWALFGWVIYKFIPKFNIGRGLGLTYIAVIFFSEFYEIPIYLHRMIYNWGSFDYILFIIKIFAIMPLWSELNILGYDATKYIKHLIRIIPVYAVGGFYLIQNYHGTINYVPVFILKFIIVFDFIVFLSRENNIIKGGFECL